MRQKVGWGPFQNTVQRSVEQGRRERSRHGREILSFHVYLYKLLRRAEKTRQVIDSRVIKQPTGFLGNGGHPFKWDNKANLGD